MATAKVSSKGWVVIPAALRRKYGICPGQQIQIVDYGGVLSLVPVLERPAHQARGSLKNDESLTEALLKERRQEKRREDRR